MREYKQFILNNLGCFFFHPTEICLLTDSGISFVKVRYNTALDNKTTSTMSTVCHLFIRIPKSLQKALHLHLADGFIQSDLQSIQAIHFYFFFISICVPWELNPWPFALLTQCSTTEPQEHYITTLQTHSQLNNGTHEGLFLPTKGICFFSH